MFGSLAVVSHFRPFRYTSLHYVSLHWAVIHSECIQVNCREQSFMSRLSGSFITGTETLQCRVSCSQHIAPLFLVMLQWKLSAHLKDNNNAYSLKFNLSDFFFLIPVLLLMISILRSLGHIPPMKSPLVNSSAAIGNLPLRASVILWIRSSWQMT